MRSCRKMSELESVIRRFPMQELAIRRLCARDSGFKEICEDHTIATCAAQRWSNDETRAAEYRELITDIEREITDYLSKAQGARA